MTVLYLYRSLIIRETEKAMLIRFPKKSRYNYMATWIPKKRIAIKKAEDGELFYKLEVKPFYTYEISSLKNSHESSIVITAEQFIEIFKGVDSYSRKELDILSPLDEQGEPDYISLKAIRELIFSENVDTAKLARDTGISRQTLVSLNKKERPLSGVKLDTLIKLQKYIQLKARKGDNE